MARPSKRATARAKVLVAVAALADRIAERAGDLKTAGKRAELAALSEALGVTQAALGVLDGVSEGYTADALGDGIEADTPEYEDPDHGEDSEHEHSDPEEGRPVAKRRIGFTFP